MKEKDKIDDKLSKLLKEESYQETTNEWFTPRVLNKLPAKGNNSARHMAWVCYIAAIVVCVAWWVWRYTTADPTVITVRDILYLGIAGIVTIMLLFSPLVAMFRRE